MNFATCLNCIDGRTQLSVLSWITGNYGYEYVDLITEPGIAGKLAYDVCTASCIIDKAQLSCTCHGSKHIFIAGHHDCAIYEGNDRRHRVDLSVALKRVEELFPQLRVTGLWVNEHGAVEEVTSQISSALYQPAELGEKR